MIKSFFKNPNIYKIFIFIFIAIYVIYNIVFWIDFEFYARIFIESINNNENPAQDAMSMYYRLNNFGMSIMFAIILFVLSSNLLSSDIFTFRKNHFNTFLKIRCKRQSYYFKALLLNGLLSGIMYIFVQLIIYLFLVFMYKDFNLFAYGTDMTYGNLFSNDNLISFLIFNLYSLIGYIVFCSLIFVLQRFVMSIYVYRGIGLILGILLVIIPAIIGVSLADQINCELFFWIGSMLFLPTLLTPGLEPLRGDFLFNSPTISWFLSFCLYCLIILVLYIISTKQERKYG